MRRGERKNQVIFLQEVIDLIHMSIGCYDTNEAIYKILKYLEEKKKCIQQKKK